MSPPALPPTVVLGPAGFARDVAEHVLAEARRDVIDLRHPCLLDTPVAILVNPRPADWDEARAANARIVVLVDGALTEAVLLDAVRAGADAVLSPDADPADLFRAANVVGRGGSYVTEVQARVLANAVRTLRHDTPLTLTARELDILESIEAGHSVKQTAIALSITVKTVENLQSRMFRKLGARNRAQAVSRAHELGLLDAG